MKRRRLQPLTALLSLAFAVMPLSYGQPNEDVSPMLPNGSNLLAYLNCGTAQSAHQEHGVQIALTHGESIVSTAPDAPFPGEAADAERVEFAVSGLQSNSDYILGFTWFDANGEGREQSVQFNTAGGWETVLPHAKPLAFHGDQPTWARVLLPIPARFILDDTLSVAFVREAGESVGVNELWLLSRDPSDARERVLIVTGDDWTGHLWRETGPEIAEILREDTRLEVSITESPYVLASPLLDHYDAVVLHFKNYNDRLPLGEVVWSGLDRYVQSGHGLVLVHFGCGAFQEWEGYVRLCGRVWDPAKRGHDPYGPFEVRVANPAHPITREMLSFETADELYTCLIGATPIDILFDATSKVDGTVHPMGFVLPESGGRVFHCTLGHDVPSLQHPGSRDLYRRATAWAAGLEP